MTTLLTNLSIFDGTGAPIAPGEVLIEGNTIAAVAFGAERIGRERAAEVIDAGGGTLMPGLDLNCTRISRSRRRSTASFQPFMGV